MLYYGENVDPADPLGYLRRTPTHLDLPRAMAARGHEVHLVHMWPIDAQFDCDGVHFHLVAESSASHVIAGVVARLRRVDAAMYQPALRAVRLIESLNPDVIHFHGTSLTLNLRLMLRSLPPPRPPIVLHYHGGYPSSRRTARNLQRYNFNSAERVCFSTRSHAKPFIEAGVLDGDARVVELMETSSNFQPLDRAEARLATGMYGDPVCLSVGRLNPIKDPLTVLQGFDRVLAERPDAQLYLYYISAELLTDIQEFLGQRPLLRDHVHFRGRADYDQMESIYSSADVLLQASLREFSGCAVLEAMACGLYPVVTDIPSFRAMTDDGRFGGLFPIGNADALAKQVLVALSEPGRRERIRAHFDQSLSFGYMASRLEQVYLTLLAGPDADANADPGAI